MAFAILKLSYNHPGDSSLTGGICGTGFFIDSLTAITACHVLNRETLAPNAGHKYVRLWLLDRNGGTCTISDANVKLHPEIDTSVISFPMPVRDFSHAQISSEIVEVGAPVRGIGHVANTMPLVDAAWQGAELVLRSADTTRLIHDRDGQIKRRLTLNINAQDIAMQDVHGFELSFGSLIGMSGGPVIHSTTNMVLGMLSIGLPPDATVKTQTFAISISHIMDRIH
jgi:hypothetical protein